MLLNYLKIAWKVLLRRKFFTFISLFGISFTLMILVVLYAMIDYTIGPHTPEKRVDRMLFANRMQLMYREGGQSNSSIGYDFLTRHVRTLHTPEKVSLSESNFGTTVAYVGQQVLKLDHKRTDGEFWQVLDFDFVSGRPYNLDEVRDAARVVVINETTSRRYFGTTTGVIGRPLVLDAVPYRVVGVVRDISISRIFSYAEIWTPVTTTTDNLKDPNYLGSYQAIILARRAGDLQQIQDEYQQVVNRLPVPDPKTYKKVNSYAQPLLASLTARFNNDAGVEGGVGRFMKVVLGMGLLFMLLPALNLININVSRTLERSAEIGVRKAFGATAGNLVGQFLLENIFLTLLGGILGLGLAAGALHLVNDSHFLAYSTFALNGRVCAVALGVILFFGILSGAYPAYKMSKLQAVKALKGETAA
ncbi:ABC transporter permease [Hymenobacter defluvii]|uniref:ABC transporter permease n=1 Tax=Hymenobacter defluvii TaxID=2054411 RepID=A0ABS3T9W5_9BACT|nr:ABC transporter permease [Hymenobacter defluvii]MBO3269414.1 ABC transporter permease [Hymenobacter defluvii]